MPQAKLIQVGKAIMAGLTLLSVVIGILVGVRELARPGDGDQKPESGLRRQDQMDGQVAELAQPSPAAAPPVRVPEVEAERALWVEEPSTTPKMKVSAAPATEPRDRQLAEPTGVTIESASSAPSAEASQPQASSMTFKYRGE